MSNCPLAHFQLGRTCPVPEKPRKKLVFTITLGTDGRNITLVMQQEGKTGQDYIAITKDTLVEIVLRGDQLFFSKDYEAITMKGANLDHFYGAIEYGEYDRERERYKSIHFVARFNKGGKVGTTHGFNVNVDLLQQVGKTARWIGLTIDPDIKNPPPQLN